MFNVKQCVVLIVLLFNIVVLFCVFNPWIKDWMGQGIVLLIVEGVSIVVIGVPVFVHHMRKGLPPRQALAESMDSVMNFLSGWV